MLDAALAREVITDHARQRRGRVPGLQDRPPVPGELENRQYNPVCGDEVVVRVRVEDVDGVLRVSHLAWTGEGCSISQASASLLHDVVNGTHLERVSEAVAHFRAMIRGRGNLAGEESLIGDGVAFAGVGRHANRVRCAMLGWVALDQALTQVDRYTTEEPHE